MADLGRVNGKRIRKFFERKDQAEAELETHELKRRQAGDVWISLTAQERLDAAHVIMEMRERGLTLRKVWDHFLSSGKTVVQTVSLDVAVKETIVAKKTGGCRQVYVDRLKNFLTQFARGRGKMPLTSITTAMIDEWFTSRKISINSRVSEAGWLSSMFSVAIRRGWATENPTKKLDPVRVIRRAPQILTVRQAAKILAWSRCRHPRYLAHLTLSMMAGIRPDELTRLSWDSVKLDEQIVIIDAAASKVRRRRIVQLEPAAVEWLKIAKENDSELPLINKRGRYFLSLCSNLLGFKRWPHDMFRHTAASYMLALKKDVGIVSRNLGNSPSILLNHYTQLVSQRDADRFWNLRPRESRKQVAHQSTSSPR